jgi:hypothetical protein
MYVDGTCKWGSSCKYSHTLFDTNRIEKLLEEAVTERGYHEFRPILEIEYVSRQNPHGAMNCMWRVTLRCVLGYHQKTAPQAVVVTSADLTTAVRLIEKQFAASSGKPQNPQTPNAQNNANHRSGPPVWCLMLNLERVFAHMLNVCFSSLPGHTDLGVPHRCRMPLVARTRPLRVFGSLRLGLIHLLPQRRQPLPRRPPTHLRLVPEQVVRRRHIMTPCREITHAPPLTTQSEDCNFFCNLRISYVILFVVLFSAQA